MPQGKKVLFKKIKDNNGYPTKEYRTYRADCQACPLKEKCIGKSFEKKICDTMDKPYYERMHERLKGSYARKMKKLRQSTVEPVLGTLINFMGMRRINTCGIKLANKGMITAAICLQYQKDNEIQNPQSAKPDDGTALICSGLSILDYFFLTTPIQTQI